MSGFYETFSEPGGSVDSDEAGSRNESHSLSNPNQPNVCSTGTQDTITDTEPKVTSLSSSSSVPISSEKSGTGKRFSFLTKISTKNTVDINKSKEFDAECNDLIEDIKIENNSSNDTTTEPNVTSFSSDAAISSEKIGPVKRFSFLSKISTKNTAGVNKSKTKNNDMIKTEKIPKRQYNLSFYDPNQPPTFWKFNQTEESPISDSLSHLSIQESESSKDSNINSDDVKLLEKLKELNMGNALTSVDTVAEHNELIENSILDFNIDLTVALKNNAEKLKPETVADFSKDGKLLVKRSETSKNLVIVNGKLMSFNELLQLYEKGSESVISYTPYNVPEGVSREKCILDILPLAKDKFPPETQIPSPCALMMKTRKKHVKIPLAIQKDLRNAFHPYLNVIHRIRHETSPSKNPKNH